MKKFAARLAPLMIAPLLVACGDQGADTAESMEFESPAGEMAAVMTMPVTTESEAAREEFYTGLYAMDMARPVEANAAFERAVADDPNFALGYLMVANTGASTDEFTTNLARAVELADNASPAEQTWITIVKRGFDADIEGQLAAAEELVEMNPESPRAWMALSNVQAGMNDIADSRESLKKAIELAPDMAAAHMQLGNNYLFLEPKDFTAAEQHFQAAIDLAPDEPQPYDLMGDVHRAQGNLEAAADDYTMAADRAPTLGSPLQQRGHVYSFLGNYEQARADYDAAIELENARGSNAGPFYLPFRAYVNIHAGDPDAAIAELIELVDNAESMTTEGVTDVKINALTNVVQIAMHYGDYETATDALEDLAVLLRQQGEEVGTERFKRGQEQAITYWEGMIAARQGDAETARAKAEELTALVEPDANPRKMEPVHQLLGITEYFQGNYEAAIEHLKQGNPNNIYMKYFLARALEETGDAESAGAIYDELAVYNFNGVTYAMIRADVLERAQM
jgi:tetratricopeptide (TPR) repeat protein